MDNSGCVLNHASVWVLLISLIITGFRRFYTIRTNTTLPDSGQGAEIVAVLLADPEI
jgi:hypothetical protein